MSLFKLIKNAGVDRLNGYNLIRKVKLTNVISFIAGVVSVLNTLGFLLNGGKPETVLNTFAIAVFHFTTILWNKFGHYVIARIWFLTFLAYTVISSVFFAGGNYLAEYIFIPCVGIPFLIFSNKELYVSIIWSGIYFGLFFFQKYLYTVITPIDPISVEEGAMMTKYLTALLFLGVIGIYWALSIESRVKESFIKNSLEKEKGLKEIAEANFTKLIESQKDLIKKERERIHAQQAEINALEEAKSQSKLIVDTHLALSDAIQTLSNSISTNKGVNNNELESAYFDLRNILEDLFSKFNLSFSNDDEFLQGESVEGDVSFGLRVLLVDDMDINRSLAKVMLNSFGCEVTEANGGNSAIEVYEEGKFDLVLMDINMPDKSGDEATQEIRSAYSVDSVFVGLSANAMEGELQEFKDIGLDDYISKPITFEKLSVLLSKWFEVKNKPEQLDEISQTESVSFLFSETIVSKNAEMVGGRKNFIKFIDKFLSENKSIWMELNTKFTVKEGDELKANLHKLSGISSSMGAVGYAELLNEAYKTLDHGRFISDEEFVVLRGASEEVDQGFREIMKRWQEKGS